MAQQQDRGDEGGYTFRVAVYAKQKNATTPGLAKNTFLSVDL
jgi:hypothetical protein